MSRYEQKIGNKYTPIVIILIVIILIAMAIWFFQTSPIDNNTKTKAIEIPQQQNLLNDGLVQDPDKSKQPDLAKETGADSEQIQTENPADRLGIKAELPELKNSDESFRTAIGSVSKNLLEWFKAKGMIKKFIIIVNDFSQGQMLYKHRAFLTPPGKIIVNKDTKGLYLAKKSYSRYDPFANAVAAIDLQKGFDLYHVFRPLFNKVYNKFSYPEEYRLEDIFLKAAANVIEAPIITDRISLVKRTISYKFADNKLESLNDVDKLMIRMGPENTKKIQAKLRQLVELVAVLNE